VVLTARSSGSVQIVRFM